MENNSLFAKRLKDERKNLGLTQAEVSEKCGISREIWGKYERSINMPGSEVLLSFSKLGADMNYLFTGLRHSENNLSQEEIELVELFRKSSELGCAVILSAARGAEKKEQHLGARKVA